MAMKFDQEDALMLAEDSFESADRTPVGNPADREVITVFLLRSISLSLMVIAKELFRANVGRYPFTED